MKSAVFAFATMMVLGFSASAESAYARECRINGGRQWAVSMSSQFDTSLCLFGSAAIGAGDFAEYKWGHGTALSIQSFVNQTSHLPNNNGVCDTVGAFYNTAVDSAGKTWNLCSFVDGSVIEVGTLAGGVSSSKNARLARALQ